MLQGNRRVSRIEGYLQKFIAAKITFDNCIFFFFFFLQKGKKILDNKSDNMSFSSSTC